MYFFISIIEKKTKHDNKMNTRETRDIRTVSGVLFFNTFAVQCQRQRVKCFTLTCSVRIS